MRCLDSEPVEQLWIMPFDALIRHMIWESPL